MPRVKRPIHKYVLVALDVLVLNLAFVLALLLHTRKGVHILGHTFPYLSSEVLFFLAYSAVIVFILYTNQLYMINVYLSVTPQIQRLLKSLTFSLVGIAVASFFTKSSMIVDSRLVILLFFVLSFVLLVAVRVILFRIIFKHLAGRGLIRRYALIIGAGKRGAGVASSLSRGNTLGMIVVGMLDDIVPAGTEVVPGVVVLGPVGALGAVMESRRVDEIIICLDDGPEDRCLNIIEQCEGTGVRVVVASPNFSVVSRWISQERYNDVPVFCVMNSQGYLGLPLLKRIFDSCLAAAGLLMLSPLLLFLAVSIKLDSRGPVLFAHTRIGKDGRPFKFYKFRSMRVGSDKDESRQEKLREFIQDDRHDASGSTKIVDDRRVTRVGKFLRKVSLDELPQLINVVKGEMSLVGPRPCLPYEWEDYAPWHKRRMSVVPGCTGVWQVFARSKVGFHDMVILDLYYANVASFPLDLWLILKTIPVMVFGSGGK